MLVIPRLYLIRWHHKVGISATVYERYSQDEYRERSGKWTMAIHWSLPHIQACLAPEHFERLKSVETNPWEEQDPKVVGKIPLINGRSGDLLANIPMPSPRRVVRGKLRDMFNTDIDVVYGQALTDLHVGADGITAIFNGGETAINGTVLIGADGGKWDFDPIDILLMTDRISKLGVSFAVNWSTRRQASLTKRTS